MVNAGSSFLQMQRRYQIQSVIDIRREIDEDIRRISDSQIVRIGGLVKVTERMLINNRKGIEESP